MRYRDEAQWEARAEALAECCRIADAAAERSMGEVGFRDSAAEFIRDQIRALMAEADAS
jgi:hypothetical protein